MCISHLAILVIATRIIESFHDIVQGWNIVDKWRAVEVQSICITALTPMDKKYVVGMIPVVQVYELKDRMHTLKAASLTNVLEKNIFISLHKQAT